MVAREEYIGDVYTGELVAPAVVIGVGQAGLNVVQTLYDMVPTGEKKYFRFIAIDSNKDDLNMSIKYEEILKITLDRPIGDFKPIISKCNYLYEDLKLRGTGVTRQRALGRFLLDYEENYIKVYNNLSSTISDLAGIHENDLYASGQVIMSIYIIHSLGGGTGSGTFPLLSAMVHNISRNVLESRGKGYFIAGIGFLPSATNLTLSVLNIDKYYFANSYAALLELKQLGEINSKKPLIIPLFNREVDKEIKIGTKPFSKYFIVGLNEEELNEVKKKRQSERYMQQRNEVVANAIYSLHKWPKGADNRWLNPETSFATFGQAELHIPIEQVKEYVKLRENIIELNGKLSKNIEELNFEYRKEIEELNKRLGKEISETKYSLDGTFNGEIRIRSIEELNEEKLSNLCQTIKQNYGLISVEYIAEKITKNLEERRNDAIQELEKYINDLWTEYEMEQKYPETISFEDKRKILGEELEEWIKNTEEWLENPPKIRFPGTKRAREEELREYKKDRSKIINIENNIDKIGKLHTFISTESRKFKEEKDKVIKAIESKKNTFGNETENIYKNITNDIETNENKLKELETYLSKMQTGRKGMVPIDVEKLKSIKYRELENIDSFSKFLEKGLITDLRTPLINQLRLAIDKSIIHKPKRVDYPKPSKDVFILCHNDNQSIVKHLIDSELKDMARTQGMTFSLNEYDKSRVSFCNYWIDIDILDLAEFYCRKDDYEKGNLGTISKIDKIGKIFAYPEWFPDDPNVQKVFTKIWQKPQ